MWACDRPFVFNHPSEVKLFKYAPANPCELNSLAEHKLATGFGLIYKWQEPNDITYLLGCIINNDTFGIITSVPQTQEFPRQSTLKQNYPNPFNASTTIEFELSEAVVVTIKVYDVLAQQITTLSDGTLSPGTHRVRWNASDFTSGAYFIQLRTPRNTQIRKAILLRQSF